VKRRRNRPRGLRGAGRGRREWVGGILAPPFYLLDREEPYRPRVVVWLELPEGRVVGRQVVMPEDLDGAVGRVLRKALTEPLVGAPRRPHAIRVDDPLSAAEVRAEVDGTIQVTVAPQPELDDVLEHLVSTTGHPQRPLSVRQRAQVQEVLPPANEAAHAGRQPTPSVHESDERLVARLTRFALREFGDAWTTVANGLRPSARSRLTGGPLVGLQLRGGRPDGRRGVSRQARPPLHAGRTRLDERAASRLAVGLGGARGRSGQDGDAARSAVRRAANRAGETRLAEPGPPRRGARPHRRPRGDLAPLRHASACTASVRRRRGRAVRQGPTAAPAGSRPHRPPAGPRFRQLPDSALGGSRECRRRGERRAAAVPQRARRTDGARTGNQLGGSRRCPAHSHRESVRHPDTPSRTRAHRPAGAAEGPQGTAGAPRSPARARPTQSRNSRNATTLAGSTSRYPPCTGGHPAMRRAPQPDGPNSNCC